MSKKNNDIELLKSRVKRMLDNKYFMAWMNRIKFTELDRRQKRAIMKQFYNEGTVSCGKIKHMEGVEGLFFVPYASQGFDLYWEPQVIRFVPQNKVAYVDTNNHTVGIDCAVGWCSSSRNSIKSIVDYFVERMVNLEIVLNTNIAIQNMPFFVGCTPESQLKAKDMVDKLLKGEPVIFGDIIDINAIQAVITNTPYVSDKLRSLFYDYENQLYTILGVDNKKFDNSNEFQLTSEIDANNVEINMYGNDIDTCIQEFIDDINETFGVNIQIESNVKQAESLYENNDEEEAKQPTVGGNEDEE